MWKDVSLAPRFPNHPSRTRFSEADTKKKMEMDGRGFNTKIIFYSVLLAVQHSIVFPVARQPNVATAFCPSMAHWFSHSDAVQVRLDTVWRKDRAGLADGDSAGRGATVGIVMEEHSVFFVCLVQHDRHRFAEREHTTPSWYGSPWIVYCCMTQQKACCCPLDHIAFWCLKKLKSRLSYLIGVTEQTMPW